MQTLGLAVIFLLLAVPSVDAQEPNYRVYGEVGFESVSEDRFVSVRPGFDWVEEVHTVGCVENPCYTDLRLSAHLPLRLIVSDDDPTQEGVIRERDWDEPSDFARVLKRLQFGNPYETIHASIGELSFVSIGNGTIVSNYVNNVQLDTFQPGVRANVNSAFGGFDLLIDNLLSPSVAGGRGFVRPFGFDDDDAFWQEFEIGVSMVSDFDAPLVIGGGPRTVDGYTAPSVEQARARSVAGFDAIFIWERERYDLFPYVDLNLSNGVGFHGGVNMALKLDDVKVWTQIEGQVFAAGYIPQYFGATYDIERYQFAGWGQNIAAPKSRFPAETENGRGLRLALGANIYDRVTFSADWSTHTIARSDSIALRLNVTPIDRVTLGAFYFKSGADDASELFDLDGAIIVSEARVTIYGPLYAMARFDQKYRLGDDATYSTTTDYLAGVGVQHTW